MGVDVDAAATAVGGVEVAAEVAAGGVGASVTTFFFAAILCIEATVSMLS